MSIRKEEIYPLYAAYGEAICNAQHLEHGIKLLLAIIQEHQKKHFPSKADLSIDGPEAHLTLGGLFSALNEKEYITGPEKRLIQNAIQTRNMLIHHYWNKEEMLTIGKAETRKKIVSDLESYNQDIRKAGKIIDSLIDKYTEEYQVQLADIGNILEEIWENDIETPPESLH